VWLSFCTTTLFGEKKLPFIRIRFDFFFRIHRLHKIYENAFLIRLCFYSRNTFDTNGVLFSKHEFFHFCQFDLTSDTTHFYVRKYDLLVYFILLCLCRHFLNSYFFYPKGFFLLISGLIHLLASFYLFHGMNVFHIH